MLIKIFLCQNWVPFKIDVHVALHRCYRQFARRRHVLSDAFDSLESVDERQRDRKNRTAEREKTNRGFLFSRS